MNGLKLLEAVDLFLTLVANALLVWLVSVLRRAVRQYDEIVGVLNEFLRRSRKVDPVDREPEAGGSNPGVPGRGRGAGMRRTAPGTQLLEATSPPDRVRRCRWLPRTSPPLAGL